MTYGIISRWESDGRVNKLLPGYPDEASTVDDLVNVRERFPLAFVAETPSAPVSDWVADPVAQTISISPLPVPSDNVNCERDRRIGGGFVFATVEYQSDPSSRENIAGAQGLSLGAMIADPQGVNGLRWADPARDFTWTSANNTEVPMTAAQCQAFCQAAMQYKTELIKAARSLKDLQPIPQDYADDRHWPSRTLD